MIGKKLGYFLAVFVVIAVISATNKRPFHTENKMAATGHTATNMKQPEKTRQEETKENVKPRGYTAEIHFRKTTLTAVQGEKRAWDLDATKVQMDEKTNKAVAYDVKGTFYSDQEPRATVVSSGADIDMTSKDILFHGEVQITTTRGEKAWSRFMKWDGKRQRLIGWNGVKVWRNDTIISGTTLEADPSFRELSVKGNVSGIF